MRNFVSTAFLLTGIFCFLVSGYVVGERTFPRNLSFTGRTTAAQACIDHNKVPIEIRIPKLSIDLPIVPSKIVNNTWETTMDGVSYLASSPVPGDQGNSILYGHNFANLLGNLQESRPGEEIEVIYNDKTVKKFTIEYTSIVLPTQIDILKPTNDKRITLYTCTGLFDSKRFVVVAFAI